MALLAVDHRCCSAHLAGANLQRHVRVVFEVEQPGRRAIRPGIGSHHDESLALLEVESNGVVRSRPDLRPMVVRSKVGTLNVRPPIRPPVSRYSPRWTTEPHLMNRGVPLITLSTKNCKKSIQVAA